jgi:hypothetical protein
MLFDRLCQKKTEKKAEEDRKTIGRQIYGKRTVDRETVIGKKDNGYNDCG